MFELLNFPFPARQIKRIAGSFVGWLDELVCLFVSFIHDVRGIMSGMCYFGRFEQLIISVRVCSNVVVALRNNGNGLNQKFMIENCNLGATS